MHLLATIPRPDGSTFKEILAPLIGDFFPPDRARQHGPYYFVRTWDDRAGTELLRISLDGVVDPGATGDELRRTARRYGCEAHIEETPPEAAPSPLWNAGFDGTGFPALSKRLYQEAAPILGRFLAGAAGEERGPLGAALDAIHLMTAHTRATLLGSPQRDLAEYGFRDLLTLRLLSYRSHFEAIYARSKDPAAFEAACARFYAQAGETARNAVLAYGDPDTGPADRTPAQEWTDFIVSSSQAVGKHFQNGTVRDAGRTLEDLERERGGPVEPTRFHIPPIPELDQLLHRDIDFLTFRLQTSVLYSCLYTLGFSLAERYVFCYVVARANEEIAGKSMKELQDDLDELARRFAAAGAAITG
ncbi:hypothetical protein [Streptomyces yaizuensis]|uniref:Thiopeptide-type bacteriocin biosynthesis domain-containing protein n=1 Tax=Streptomyces yaizuensis TaxID=2989713 RepID=A0ABQ5P480_9ACTN|nr:hypothetical protein [Streptomyces sp. YSPA8]GLF97395.1 hypothetical protein SYYSPA8_23880 [Streptomyces sp. YSPA8]